VPPMAAIAIAIAGMKWRAVVAIALGSGHVPV
jgi:hypothetical protein